jgi:serine/threonine-protein kinase
MDIGDEFAGHRIEGLIGRGGMGVVYLATHLRLGRKAAIKILSPELAADEAFRRRFIRESQLAASLEHPNIVPVFDAGEVDGIAYISMRYVAGPDLSTFIKSTGQLNASTTIAITEQIASALDAAHASDLVHRDVKPANVLLDPPGEDGSRHAYLTDFGVTKSRTAAETTETGHFIGTVAYTAPEQILGQVVDGRTDQYALACVLFECLTGRVPYPQEQEFAVMAGHVQEPPPRVSARGVAVTEELDDVIIRGMAKRPDRRFGSCMELVQHTASALGVRLETPMPDRTVASTAVRPSLPGREEITKPLPGPDGGSPDAKSPRRRVGRVVAALAVALALVVGTVVAVVALTGPDEGATGPTTGPSLPGETVSPATASTSPSEKWTPPPFPAEITWARVGDPLDLSVGGDQLINREAVGEGADGPLIVAVGYETKGKRTNGALWASIDGSNWLRKRVGSFGGPGEQILSAVTYSDDDRFVAIGTNGIGHQVDGAVWTSGEGLVWMPSEGQIEALGGRGIQQFRKLTSTPTGLVAVGSDTRYGGGHLDAAVWVSTDGTNWTEDYLHHDEGEQELWGVTRFQDGLVAVGSESIEGEQNAAVWRKAPGEGWERVGAGSLAEPGSQLMKAVVSTPNGLIAVGNENETTPAVWTSTDGEQWVRVSREMFETYGSVEITGVTAFRGGAIMVGAAGPGEHERDAAVWVSPDGRTWSPSESVEFGGPDSQIIKSIVPFKGRLVAVGVDQGGNGADGAAWLGTPVPASSPNPSATTQTPEEADGTPSQ